MAVARVACRAQIGLLAPVVQVEVHLGAGLPCFNIVGLPATEVKESKERVRAALVNSGFELPAGRITINLAPVDRVRQLIIENYGVGSGEAAWCQGADPILHFKIRWPNRGEVELAGIGHIGAKHGNNLVIVN